jgi:hypothetical protein
MGGLRAVVAFFSVSRGSEARRGVLAGIAFALSMFMLLTGVMVALPAEQAEADSLELGPDGYFSAMEAGATPVASDGWDSTATIRFGRSGHAADTYQSKLLGSAYKTLARGEIASEEGVSYMLPFASSTADYAKASTTYVAADEVLLLSDEIVTDDFTFKNSGSDRHIFDSSTYQSNLSVVSNNVGYMNYTPFEQQQLRNASIEGVCTQMPAGCVQAPYYTSLSASYYSYRAFPLSASDLPKYLNYTGENVPLACTPTALQDGCQGYARGWWTHSGFWNSTNPVVVVDSSGIPKPAVISDNTYGFRPAVRLQLQNLLLSAYRLTGNQDGNDLQLTFVDRGKKLTSWDVDITSESNEHKLVLSGDGDYDASIGWKLVDPSDPRHVRASGITSSNVTLPNDLDSAKSYDLYVWGTEQTGYSNFAVDGSWTLRATEPVKLRMKGWQIKSPPSYGIELTGRSDGALTAYKIGDYKDEVFDQTGALKSVMLNTPTVPSGLKTVLKNATVAAGGSDVDAGNPIGWVASRWLGYPTDPLSDDVTSAFSPYAGQLQLLAQELAKHTDALGTSAGSLPAGMFSTLMTETLPVSGPGLYLIVDSKQNEGGSLPIIVGSKVFNEALEDVVDGGMVDFADAGVKGKPRLGQAALKTSITDVAKRIVNDAGVDGFDVGAEVEFEVALRVPDLSSFTSVAYDSYKFNLTDVAASGLTLPVDGSGVEVFVDALSPTEPQSLPPGLIAVSGDTLSVDGLKVLFAESSGSGVKNKNTVPAGSLMRFRYAAVLNTTASFSAPGGGGLAPNANTVTLTRSTSDGDTEQKTASANAYSFKVDVVKVDKDDTSTALGDAKFEVSRDGQALKFTQVSAGVYRLDAVGGTEVTTHADGTLTLLGVEARDLSFRETQAPDGYFTVSDFTVEVVPVWNADASEVTVASYRTGGTNLAYVSQDGRSVTVADPSKSLANLPYTGGVGILLLLIIGGVFLMVAVRPYYLSHRAEATANILM